MYFKHVFEMRVKRKFDLNALFGLNEGAVQKENKFGCDEEIVVLCEKMELFLIINLACLYGITSF